MANTKFTQLTTNGTITPTDILPIIQNVPSVPVPRKVSIDTLQDVIANWTPAGETWTYASATTFTVSGDVTSKYPKGAKIKLVQTSTKYFYVAATSYSAPNTTITITGGNDYVLTNAAITSPFYSYVETPTGFPSYFNYTPDWNAATVNPAIGNGSITGKFNIAGKVVNAHIRISMGTTTTYGTGTYTFGLPTAASQVLIGSAIELDAGVQYYIGTVKGSGVSTVSVTSNAGPSVWSNTQPQTWASGDWLELSATYFL